MVHSVFLRKINRSLGVQCSISSVCNAVQFKVETPQNRMWENTLYSSNEIQGAYLNCRKVPALLLISKSLCVYYTLPVGP